MANVDLNKIAADGIEDIQKSIDRLNAVIVLPGADVDGITKQIDELMSRQTQLTFNALALLEERPENQAAINALNKAAKALTDEAAKEGQVATAVSGAAKVISAASSLISTFAPLLV